MRKEKKRKERQVTLNIRDENLLTQEDEADQNVIDFHLESLMG